MALSLEERVDPKHGMLIVVDMQNDFCHRDGAACKRGQRHGVRAEYDSAPRKSGEPSARASLSHLLRPNLGQSMDELTGLDRV